MNKQRKQRIWRLIVGGLIVMEELLSPPPKDREGRGEVRGEVRGRSEHNPPWPKERPFDFRAPAPEPSAPQVSKREVSKREPDTSDLTGWPWQPGKVFKTWEEKQKFLDDMLNRGEELRREEAKEHGRDPYSSTPAPWKLPEYHEEDHEGSPEDPPAAPCPWDPAE